MQLTINHRGVWIPWSEGNEDQREAHQTALMQRARAAGAPEEADAVLIAEVLGGETVFGLGDARTVTPRSAKPHLRRGLAFVDRPTVKDMARAIAWARNGVVAVLEGPPSPFYPALGGWAAAVGAIDALTGARTEPVPDPIRQQFEHLAHYGNNGYHGAKHSPSVQQMVPRIAAEIRAAGYNTEFIVSYLLAYGLHEKSEQSLRQLIGG